MADDTCDLCRLPLRFGSVPATFGGKAHHFCCIGCRQVFQTLLEASDSPDPARFRETDLFRQCRRLGIIPAALEDLAGPSLHRTQAAPQREDGLAAPAADDRLLRLRLQVAGMWCPACAWVIEQSLARSPGVAAARCIFSTDRVDCWYDPVQTAPERIIAVLLRLGYTAAPPEADVRAAEKRRDLIRLAISALLSMNVMMLSFALYSGFFGWIDTAAAARISWPIVVMASIVFFYGGAGIHKKGWAGLAGGAPGMETLISVGAASAYAFSLFNFLNDSLHLYFDTASMLITLVLLGKMIERSARDRMREDVSGFFSLRPTKARLCTPDNPDGRYVSADLLRPGDVIAMAAGEIATADGIVLSGGGRLDESALTGEPQPVEKGPGDWIRSGTRLLSGNVRVRAERVGEASLLGEMITIMERALGEKTSLEGRTDRLLRCFVPAILLLAVATAAGCLLAGTPLHAAFLRAVTVLVIACPCSLGIAIPMARAAGLSLAAKNGLVVRDFSAFETAADVDAVIFDKTGTVTEGSWTLKRIRLLGELSAEEALALAAGLEEGSDHTAARPIREETRRQGIAPAPLSQIQVQANGISARFNGQPLKIGAEAFVHPLPPQPPGLAAAPAGDGADVSRVLLSLGGAPCAVFEFGDSLRNGAAETIRRLQAEGHRIAVISGDGDAATRQTAARLGVTEAAGGMLPRDKAAFVAAVQAGGYRVAMVGDGVNDAPALARSDLAVAVHAASRLGKEAADVTLMRGDPRQILLFFELAGRTRRKIHQNLWCAFVYNLVGIPVAMSGLLTPLVAVCAMLLSSLTVILNTLRLSGEPAPAERPKVGGKMTEGSGRRVQEGGRPFFGRRAAGITSDEDPGVIRAAGRRRPG